MRHAGIYVSDLEKMKEFYCKYFGMTESVHSVEQSLYIDTVLGKQGICVELYKLKTKDDGLLELLEVKNKNKQTRNNQDVCSLGQMHIALTVDNVDEMYHDLRQQGIEFLSRPCISPDGYAKVCFCKDLEGNYIELVEVI